MNRIVLSVAVAAWLILSVSTALAQRAGQMATIRYGTVVGMQTVDLDNADAMKGALVGGAFGAASGAAKRQTGRLYSVRTNEGTVIQILCYN